LYGAFLYTVSVNVVYVSGCKYMSIKVGPAHHVLLVEVDHSGELTGVEEHVLQSAQLLFDLTKQ